jgi:hypothetical protein
MKNLHSVVIPRQSVEQTLLVDNMEHIADGKTAWSCHALTRPRHAILALVEAQGAETAYAEWPGTGCDFALACEDGGVGPDVRQLPKGALEQVSAFAVRGTVGHM